MRIGIFLLLTLGVCASAGAAEVRIGFIDIQKAVSETKEFQRAFTRFRSDFQKEKQAIGEREKKIKDMLDAINKQGFALAADEKKRKEEEFIKAKKDFERYVQDRNDEFSRREKEITDAIVRKMLEVIKKVGKERGYTMILEKKAVFYSDTASDLTEMVTKTYDQTNK